MGGGTGERDAALIVGASSGIGAALARELVARGYRVALVARRDDALETLAASLNAAHAPHTGPGDGSGDASDSAMPVARRYAHDVRAFDDAPALFARIAAEMAPLRLVVYVAGVMPLTTTGVDFDVERAMVETNTLGAIRWLGLAATHCEREGCGTLVGISSVAGDRGRPGNGAYQASKAALTTYLDALRYRLHPAGVRVVTVKPGYVATPLTAGLPLPRALTIAPEAAARAIARACAGGPEVAYVPGYWRAVMWGVRLLPARAVARLPG
jgi:short-subunit dehydrogenase